MKNHLVAIFTHLAVLMAGPSKGQTAMEKVLMPVATLEDAQEFVHDHPGLKPSLHQLNAQRDTTVLDKRLYKAKKGAIITIGSSAYKVIEDTTKTTFRASYIYLDGSKLTRSVIDSIRSLILKRQAAGETFEKLADEYNMDSNAKHGDTGPFGEKMMVKEFEDAVRNHARGDIFKVDIPAFKWYYVVKKTAKDQITREITVLGIKMH